MEEPKKHSHMVVKIVGGLFAAVIAPLLTGIALIYIQKWLDPPKPDAPAKAESPADQVASSPAKVAKQPPQVANPPAEVAPARADRAGASAPAEAKATTVTKTKDQPKSLSLANASPEVPTWGRRPFLKKKARTVMRLFNGRDLTGFETYFGAPQGGNSAYGRNHDPEKVFTVQGGLLHVSGKVFGGLLTQSSYENYHLTVEYKWGEKRWPPRADLPRMGGIVLHGVGTPGDIRGWSIAGITCELSEIDTGALNIPTRLAKPISLTAHAEKHAMKKADRFQYVFKPGAPLTTVQSGSIHALDHRPIPAMKAALGKVSHGPSKPIGEWNKLECICSGDRITVVLNGTTINVATRVSQTRGKIFIESHGAEIWFRTIDLKPEW